MKSLLSFVCLIYLVQDGMPCKYWCRKPLSFEYVCCDTGNPFLTTTEAPTTVDKDNVNDAPATAVKQTANDESVGTQIRRGCRYYCVYADRVYCCDDGSSPLPADHNVHDGRCPAKKEQVCKKGGIYLHVRASKMTTKSGEKALSSKGGDEEHPNCASDGYCLEDEKCCENICAKKHTCLKAVYDYGPSSSSDSTQVTKKKKARHY